MTGYDLFKFLFKWKWTLVLGTVSVAALVAWSSLREPPRYEAAARVLIERNRTPIQIGNEQVPALGMLEVMNTEIEIARSRTVIAAAVDTMPPAPVEEAPPLADGPIGKRLAAWMERAWAWMLDKGLVQTIPDREEQIRNLSGRLDVTPVPDSNVFTISMTGGSPKRVADTVNAVTEMYLKHRLSVYKAQGRSRVFEQQMETALQELVALRTALETLKRDHNLAAADDMRRTLAMRAEVLAQQRATISQELADLRQRYLDRYPAVISARERLALVNGDIANVEAELRRIDARHGEMRNLEVEIEGQLATYNQAKARYEEQAARENASIAATNVLVIEYADLPVAQSSTRLAEIGIGAVAGLLLAFVIALLREYFDTRVDEPDQAERIIGVPVVGSVGRFSVPRRGFRPRAS